MNLENCLIAHQRWNIPTAKKTWNWPKAYMQLAWKELIIMYITLYFHFHILGHWENDEAYTSSRSGRRLTTGFWCCWSSTGHLYTSWPSVMWLRNVSRYAVAKIHRALTACCVYPIPKAHVDMGPAHVCTHAVHPPVHVPPLTWTGGRTARTWTWAMFVGARVRVRFFLWILWDWWHITPQMGPRQGGPFATTSDLNKMEKRLQQQYNALQAVNQKQHKDMQSVQSIIVVSLSWLINTVAHHTVSMGASPEM